MLEGRKNKKMMAIKWLQSSTVYWFYYISVYPWANKNTRQAIKRIWSEQNVVELLSAAYMHLAAFLPPHTWKRAEGGPRLCPPLPPPLPSVRSRVNGLCPASADRWQGKKWRRPAAAAPFTRGDRSDPSSQPRWTLLRCPDAHVQLALRCRCHVLPRRSRLQPIKP